MPIYALDDIDDAIEATKALLWPIDRWLWVKFAFIVFFLGGVGGSNPFQFAGNTPSGPSDGMNGPGLPESIPALGGPEILIILGIIGIITVIALVFLLIGSIMEFVFVRSLSDESVSIRDSWSKYWTDGVRLFGFRLVLGILTFGIIGILIAAAFAPILLGNGTVRLALIPLAIIVAIPVGLLSGIIHTFTTAFIVPLMMLEEHGVIAGWRRFWSTLTGQWKQYVSFLILGFVLNIAGGIVAGLATLLVAVVLAIPLGILALIGVGLLNFMGIVGGILIALAVITFVIAIIVAALLIAVPIQVFLRYYALLVLGDTNENFDIIADRREKMRS